MSGFDPGRRILRESLTNGIAAVRQNHPNTDDEFMAGFLSGFLGAYVVATENTIKERIVGAFERGYLTERQAADLLDMDRLSFREYVGLPA